MNDNDTQREDEPGGGHSHDHDSRRGRRTGLGRKARLGVTAALLVTLGAVLGSLATVSATAGAHMFGGFGGRGAGHTMEQMTERALDRTAWVLDRLDASDGQAEQVRAAVTTVIGELQPIRDQHLAYRQDFVAELLRGAPDRGKLENLRQEELRLADLASARLLDAAVEVAQVLTPEQRDELLAFATRRGGRH